MLCCALLGMKIYDMHSKQCASAGSGHDLMCPLRGDHYLLSLFHLVILKNDTWMIPLQLSRPGRSQAV